MEDPDLPFLVRPRTRGSSQRSCARTAAFQAMNQTRIAEAHLAAHEGSRIRMNRLPFTTHAAPAVVPSPPSSAPAQAPRLSSSSVVAAAAAGAFVTSRQSVKQPSSLPSSALRDDAAHVWWPKYFDGLAFNEHLERLLKSGSASHEQHEQQQQTNATDARNAFESLDLVADTLRGTPACELLREVRRVLYSVVFRPCSKNELLRDVALGLELEVDQLRAQLKTTQNAYEKLHESTARQVKETNARRVSTDIASALQSSEVAEATMQRVQRESSEMATRLQHSLAQQQLVRAKLIDLGMRNIELRHILEAQKRAATARSWEDAIPAGFSQDASTMSSNSNSNNNNAGNSLDRSALHILGDVVSSSQTELANLVEFRQKLSGVIFGE